MRSNSNESELSKKTDFEMSYRLVSDAWTPYFSNRIPFRTPPSEKNETALVAAFISNCGSHNHRERYMAELMKFIRVDSYGRCHHTTVRSVCSSVSIAHTHAR